MKISIVILIFILVFPSSIQDDAKNPTLIRIPVYQSFNNLSEIKCSQFIYDFEYIQLETSEKCLIGDNPEVLILKDHILVYRYQYCYVFERRTGKFLYELGHYGKGPGEYYNGLFAVDLNQSVFYFGGWNYTMMMYNFDGRYLGSFPFPYQKRDFEDYTLMLQFSSLPNSLIVGYSVNLIGTENKLLTIFNQSGEVIKIFPNRNILPKQKFKLIIAYEALFYQLNNETFFKERYNDTLFKVTKKKLVPYLLFSLDHYTIPYKSKFSLEEQKKADFIDIKNIFENRAFICFLARKESIDYFGLYNRKQNKLSISKLNSGLLNDLDNFISFNPRFTDQVGNLVSIVNPLDLEKWVKANPSKLNVLPDKILKLQHISIENNPIIMIGKTKTID
jgi:hypothetical protein